MESKVDNYIDSQPKSQREILARLRMLILKTFPKIHEEMKMGVPWYEGKFYLVSLKDHVNLGFAVLGMPQKYSKQLEGKGKYMRHLKFYSIDDINKKKLVELLKQTHKSYIPAHNNQ